MTKRDSERIERVTRALKKANVLYGIDAIEIDNQKIYGPQIVLWINGMGHPVNTIREAVDIARKLVVRGNPLGVSWFWLLLGGGILWYKLKRS